MNPNSEKNKFSRLSELFRNGNHEEENEERGRQRLLRLFAHIVLFVLLFVFPFYAPEGYLQITTHKFEFLKRFFAGALVIVFPFFVINECRILVDRGEHTLWKKIKTEYGLPDLFAGLFLLVNIVSYFLSEYKEIAFRGTDGWYMGLFTYLGCFLLYFIFSRGGFSGVRPEILFLPSAVIFLWAVLNRFSVYPVDMKYYEYDFISCLGNINWFAGYWTFFMAGAMTWYMLAEKKGARILSGIYYWLTILTGLLQGSDGAFVAMAALGLFFMWFCFEKETRKKRFTEMVILAIAVCLSITLLDRIFPWRLVSLSEVLVYLVHPLMLIPLVLFTILRITQEKRTAGIRVRNLHFLAAGILLLAALMLLIVNTLYPGSIGPLSRFGAFTFNEAWGSQRGKTWADGLSAFRLLKGPRKLIGAGPDCFFPLCYSDPERVKVLNLHFNGNILTNAHNECITMLVNQGILGLLTFLGMLLSYGLAWMKNREKTPEFLGFTAALLAYFFYNMFSFQQILSLPLLFTVMGIGRSLLRNGGKAS